MSDDGQPARSDISRPPVGDVGVLPVVQQERIPVKEIHAKYSTKYELYRFLASRNNVYLPHQRHVTIYYLKDILSGKKMRK